MPLVSRFGSTRRRAPGVSRRPAAFRGSSVRRTVCALVIAFLPPASPQVGAQVRASSDYLVRMDTDRNGRVSMSEYQDWLCYGFDALDRNHDGMLVVAELPGGRGTPLSRQDHRERLAAAFRRQDRNGDGALDTRELAAPPR